MPAHPCSPKAVHSFLVPTRKSNSDPDLVKASGMMNGLAMWNMKKRRIWDHGSWQAEQNKCLEDVEGTLVSGRALSPSFPDQERRMAGTDDGEGSSRWPPWGSSRASCKGDTVSASLPGNPAESQWDKETLPTRELQLEVEGEITLQAERDLPNSTKWLPAFLLLSCKYAMKSEISLHGVAEQDPHNLLLGTVGLWH